MVSNKALTQALVSLPKDIIARYPDLTDEQLAHMIENAVVATTPYVRNILNSNIRIQASHHEATSHCIFIYSGRDGSLSTAQRYTGKGNWEEC